MNIIKISWYSIKAKALSATLSIILLTFGTGLLTIILLAAHQISHQLESNAKDVDLVVGAKGSPLQLILSNIYYMDFPTGNIPLDAATELSHNPFVKLAVPLAQGDNYEGYRIIGTDSNFLRLHHLKIADGRRWRKDFEVTIGANIAQAKDLKIGDKFFGAHGLTSQSDTHKDHSYRIVGVLSREGGVTDNLILTNVASVWKMHDHHSDHQEHEGQRQLQEGPSEQPAVNEEDERELTALLIQYRSPMSVVMFPRMVNEMTNLQAASPAMESARLFSLIGIGVDTLQWLAFIIIIIAALSVFFNLYNALKERKYDLAIMRTLGASPMRIFLIVLAEGVLIAIIGSIAGIVSGHLILELLGHFQDAKQVSQLIGSVVLMEEIYIFAGGLLLGAVATLLPAVQAYRTDISAVLSNK